MDVKRKVAMAAATLAVAFGVGHLMQNGLIGDAAQVAQMPMPAAITPLAAGLGQAAELAVRPTERAGIALPDAAFDPAPITARPAAAMAEDAICTVTLDVIASTEASLDLTLLAPCRPSARVVLHHGGLTITAMTSLTGTLFTSLPGMEPTGAVSASFNDGVKATAAAALPDMMLYRRFAVQSQASDSFQMHAFEGGALYGAQGHVSAATPQRRLPNIPTESGYLTLLGDSTAPTPLLAEVYTYPQDPTKSVDLSIEAAVTEASCDRELLGEVLFSDRGTLTKADLTMATPPCDAVGDVLVLNNPLPDLKLAAAN